MLVDPTLALSAFVTLFVVIDPIGTSPMFVAITQGMDDRARRAVALRACTIAAGLLLIFGLFGRTLLDIIGVSLDAFRISGGILLFLIAVDMLFARRTERREQRHSTGERDPSVFPLATPLVAGPGAMAAMMLLTGDQGSNVIGSIQVFVSMIAVLGLVLALFLMAGAIERAMGRTGTLVVTRLMGMLLAALSVQFVLDGLRGAGALPG